MKLSTRSRYGVRMMAVLATNPATAPVLLREVATSESISEKYLSQIVIPLRNAGLLRSVRGAHGGYVLGRDPSAITVREVVDVLEGGFALVDVTKNGDGAQTPAARVIQGLWSDVSSEIGRALGDVTLSELARRIREQRPAATMYNI